MIRILVKNEELYDLDSMIIDETEGTVHEVDAPSLDYVELVDGAPVVITEEELVARKKQTALAGKLNTLIAAVGDEAAQQEYLVSRKAKLKGLTQARYENLVTEESIITKIHEVEALFDSVSDIRDWISSHIKDK